MLLATLLVSLSITGSPPAGSEPRWVSPISPVVVTRGFDLPETAYGPGHRGVDLAGAAHGPVASAGRGTVTYAGMLAGRGVLVVDHGELRTTYEPVRALVSVGDVVAPGEILGLLDSGHVPGAGPRLHWGLLRGEAYLDPLALLGRGAVRLLPFWPAAEPGTGGRSRPAPRAESPVARGGGTPIPGQAGRRVATIAGLATVTVLAATGLGIPVSAGADRRGSRARPRRGRPRR